MTSHASLRLAATSVAVLALTGAGLSTASAAPGAVPSGKTGPAKTSAAAPASMSVGVIVHTTKDAPTSGDVSRIARAASAPIGAATTIDTGLLTIAFDAAVPTTEATATAAEIAQLPGVESAEPDVLLTATTAAPVRPNDSQFDEQLGVWDQRTFTTAEAPGWAPGGFSVRAPYLWRATKGSAAKVVAVIDTGFTVHPDLNANRVAGYDFLSLSSDETAPAGRDGDAPTSSPVPGWDVDAADPGDFTTSGQCGVSGSSESSWHGTHVAGIVAAVDGNRTGISGVAPDVRFQPIRALGPCGGSTSDIATAIKWAAGVAIPGVSKNKTPASVINLSLGGSAPCGTTFQEAVNAARAKGAVVVAAAGNSNSIGLGSPASCAGAIAVTATDEFGQRASYSNRGNASRQADIAAPGGDSQFEGYSGILSTINTGTTTPGAAGYIEYDGTSMASPHVAAGAALMSSLGYSRSQIEAGLKRAVRPFPQYGGVAADYNCTSSQDAGVLEADCGRGILDLAQVPALFGSRTITGTAKKGKTLTIATRATTGTRTYAWFRNGKAIRGATRSTYKLKSADKGKKVSARVTVTKTGFKTLAVTTAARKVAG